MVLTPCVRGGCAKHRSTKPNRSNLIQKAGAATGAAVHCTHMLEPLHHRVQKDCHHRPLLTVSLKGAYKVPTEIDAANANTVAAQINFSTSCLPPKLTQKEFFSKAEQYASGTNNQLVPRTMHHHSSQSRLLEQAQCSLLAA